jgi:hypothetical protein
LIWPLSTRKIEGQARKRYAQFSRQHYTVNNRAVLLGNWFGNAFTQCWPQEEFDHKLRDNSD